MFENIKKMRSNDCQYALVGLALEIFYVLLSLSSSRVRPRLPRGALA